MSRKNKGHSKHDKFVDDIANTPRRLTFTGNDQRELTDIIISCPEANLLHPRTGVLIGKPDILMMDKYGRFYIIEYKCHDKRKGAKIQLDRNKSHIIRYMPSIEVITIYAHDKYKGEIIR